MILCCGEALIDMVPVAGGEGAFAPLPGGAIFNTAIALGRLDVPVQFCSGVSRDLFGMQLEAALQASNVGTDLLVRSDRPTTLAFVKLTDGQAAYTFYDENSAGRMVEADDLPEVGSQVSALYFGGISLCAEPAADAYAALAVRAGQDRVVMIDPNIRTSFIQDEAVYRMRLMAMMGVADIVKVSDEDLDWIVPEGSDIAAKVASLHAIGPKLVLVTRGGDGAAAYPFGRAAVEVPVPAVVVVDTVGAGDTFNAGFLAYLSRAGLLDKTKVGALSDAELAGALAFGADVAAVTVSRAGANPPYLSEL